MISGIISGIIIVAFLAGVTGYVILGSYAPTGNVLGIPDYALKSPSVQKAYESAVEMQDKLQYLPCYCGCGMGEMEHRGNTVPKMTSLKDCFIKADGSGFEDHAAMDCGGCVSTANDAAEMIRSGMPLIEVRKAIDSKYGNEFGTDTPMPPEGI